MILVQTGNMLDVVVEGKSLGLKPRGSDEVLWLPEPDGLRSVLEAEINRLKPPIEASTDAERSYLTRYFDSIALWVGQLIAPDSGTQSAAQRKLLGESALAALAALRHHTAAATPSALSEAPPEPPRRPKQIERIEQRNNHDCLRCCIAMVTGIRYEDVPDFCESAKEAWPSACDAWLSEMGYGLLMFGSSAPDFVPSWLPIIAQGPTSTGTRYHFVVVTDDEIIDPWPSQPGLTEIKERYAIVNSGSLVNGFIDHLAKRYSEARAELAALRSVPVEKSEDEADNFTDEI